MVAKPDSKRRPLGMHWARENTEPNCHQKMEMDWAHSEEANRQHHKASTEVEPARQQEQRQIKKHLEKTTGQRDGSSRP